LALLVIAHQASVSISMQGRQPRLCSLPSRRWKSLFTQCGM